MLEEASLLLNTSITEGVPAALIEALNFKVPLLVRNNEGNVTVVKHRVNGLLFEDAKDFMEL